jgi:hypothetical protein
MTWHSYDLIIKFAILNYSTTPAYSQHVSLRSLLTSPVEQRGQLLPVRGTYTMQLTELG